MENRQTKKVRLYINGVRQKDIRPNMTKWQIFIYKVKVFFKVLFWGIIVAGVLIGIYYLGAFTNPKTIYTKAEIIKEIEMEAPILFKIAKAESLNSHYCLDAQIKAKMCSVSEKGQVLLGENGKTVDIGKYQINNYWWGAKATEMGLNLWIEKDNETMAKWIFKNYGSEPWDSSSSRWSSK